ncbi:MAG: DUF2802 domain-containing protein [Rheinheimera sp.]|nr:DUF2802 domain-containing protein [Rheinheimera sp.]
MQQSVIFPFEWLVIGVIPAVAILLVVFVIWQHQRQRQSFMQLLREHQQTLSAMKAVQIELDELRGGLIGVGQRVLQLETAWQRSQQDLQMVANEIEQISEHQQKMQLFDPESKLYNRAMKMVQLGAGLEEIMLECELPRAEAELLLNLHRQGK